MGVKSAQPCKITIIFINIQSTNYPLKPQPGDLPVFNPWQRCLMCFQHKSIAKAVLDVWHHKTISWMSCHAQGKAGPAFWGGYLSLRQDACSANSVPQGIRRWFFFLMFPTLDISESRGLLGQLSVSELFREHLHWANGRKERKEKDSWVLCTSLEDFLSTPWVHKHFAFVLPFGGFLLKS